MESFTFHDLGRIDYADALKVHNNRKLHIQCGKHAIRRS